MAYCVASVGIGASVLTLCGVLIAVPPLLVRTSTLRVEVEEMSAQFKVFIICDHISNVMESFLKICFIQRRFKFYLKFKNQKCSETVPQGHNWIGSLFIIF